MLAYTLESPEHSIELQKDLSLMLINKRFQRSCQGFLHFHPGPGIVNTPNSELSLNNIFAHCAAGVGEFMKIPFFLNIFRVDLFFDALIIGLV